MCWCATTTQRWSLISTTKEAPPVQAGAPEPCVAPGQTPLAESSLHPWASQCGSRHLVEAGAEARGMDASHRGSEAYLEGVWPGSGGPLCDSGGIAMSPLVLCDSFGSTGAGCHGTDEAEASSVCFPPIALLPGVLARVLGRGQSTSGSTILAGPSMVLRHDFSPQRLSMGDFHQEGSPLTGRGHHCAPLPGVVETVSVATEGAHLIASGLSTEVVETIL